MTVEPDWGPINDNKNKKNEKKKRRPRPLPTKSQFFSTTNKNTLDIPHRTDQEEDPQEKLPHTIMGGIFFMLLNAPQNERQLTESQDTNTK